MQFKTNLSILSITLTALPIAVIAIAFSLFDISFSNSVVLGLATAIVAAPTYSYALNRYLTGKIAIVCQQTKNMSQGNFNCKLSFKNKDILAELSNDLDVISENFTKMTTELNSTSSIIKKGKLRHRADATDLQGSYSSLVNGFNALADVLVSYIDAFPVPAMIVDREFNVKYLNKVGCNIGGIETRSADTMKCHNIFKTGDCQSEKCAISKAMQTGNPCDSETIAHPNGNTLAIKYSASPIKDDDGNIIGALEIVVDQTEIKKAMLEAQKSVDNMNNLPTPIMTVDNEYNITYINPAGAAVTGKTPQQVIGQKCYSLFKTGHCQTENCRCHKAMFDGRNHTGETVVDPDNLNIPIMYTGAPIKDADGKIVGALEYIVDITDIKNAQRKMQKVDEYQKNEVNKFAAALNRLAVGDLEIVYTAATADDDTASVKAIFDQLASSLSQLLKAMEDISDLAKEISVGNLTVTASKRSEEDVLMEALDNMINNLTRFASDVQTASAQIAAGSEQMSSTSQQMAQGASEQAASIEEISSSMEEMASTVRQNADSAQQTTAIAQKAASDAQQGGKAVDQTVTAMNSIAQKINIIEEIARQTNMLALNAAIEAARAGEHGKGFAVVASEVRKLAERSQNAAQEISTLSTESVDIAQKAGKLLQDIVPGIQKTAELIEEINTSSAEQSSGIDQVTQAIHQLDQVVQQNSSATEELASTSEEFTSQAEQLMKTSEFFVLDKQNYKPIKSQTIKTKVKAENNKKAPIKADNKPTNKKLQPVSTCRTGGIDYDLELPDDVNDSDFN